ncbi:uncharacterized protein LOC135815043 [Sycon ciliatum]|uniref:uncharacterized protein LOC135815043 n=1 Tax=Sycon ciliatum TaxID=27933 RepID=UPI0031F61431
MATKEDDLVDKDLSDSSSGYDEGEDDDEDDFAPSGYEPLAQSSDEDGDDADNTEGAAAAAAAVPPMETDQADKIKSLMSGFSLPDTAVPEWAKNVPEDVWKGKLVEGIHNESSNAERKKQKKKKGRAAAAAEASAAIGDQSMLFPAQDTAASAMPAERKRRLSFSQDDDDLIARVQNEVGLQNGSDSAATAASNGDSAQLSAVDNPQTDECDNNAPTATAEEDAS